MAYFLPVLLLLCAFTAASQPVPNRPSMSVDWSAWIELVLPVEPIAAKRSDPQATIEVLKLSTDTDLLLGEPIEHSLAPKLWELAKSGELEMFADAELTRRQDFESVVERLLKPDTILQFDAQTYEERVVIVAKNESLPYLSKQIIVRQLLYYHNSTATFSVQTYAIAPCNADGEPFYWLKVPEMKEAWPENYRTQADIPWAIRYTTLDTSPGPDTWAEIKNTTGPLIGRLMDRIRPDTSVNVYDAAGDLVLPENRRCFFGCKDTTVVFDPGVERNEVEAASLDLNHQEIEQLQLIEEWCWREDGVLFTRLIGIAPRYFWIAPIGKTSAWRVAFYRYCDELKGP